MTPIQVLTQVIHPTLEWMGPPFDSAPAALFLLTVQQQEDKLCTRCQAQNGPARGLWQFEPTGTYDVLINSFTAHHAEQVLNKLDVTARSPLHICNSFQFNDRLACAFARLLLWSHPKPLPPWGQMGEAWSQYVQLWRPGKPHPLEWPHNYQAASTAMAQLSAVGLLS